MPQVYITQHCEVHKQPIVPAFALKKALMLGFLIGALHCGPWQLNRLIAGDTGCQVKSSELYGVASLHKSLLKQRGKGTRQHADNRSVVL